MAATATPGRYLNQLVDPETRWQTMAGPASAGVSLGHLRSDPLLVDRQERGAYTDHHHAGIGRTAAGSHCLDGSSENQQANQRRHRKLTILRARRTYRFRGEKREAPGLRPADIVLRHRSLQRRP